MSNIDHEYTKEIVCPYCGYEQSDSWEFSDSGDIDCGECDKTFDYERQITVEYSSSKKQCTDHDYHLRKSSPYFISKRDVRFENGKSIWTDKEEKDFQYYRWYVCSICDKENIVEIQKGEYGNETSALNPL